MVEAPSQALHLTLAYHFPSSQFANLESLVESINPNVQGDLRFVDSETQETLDITNASELLNVYNDQRLWLQSQLDTMCRSRQGRFLSASSGSSIQSILFDQLCRQGWILR